MGGPNLEVFKVRGLHVISLKNCKFEAPAKILQFGLYIFFPITFMYYYGTNLDERFKVHDFWPKPEQTNRIPHEREEIQAELERLKQKRLYLREKRLEMQRRQGGGDVEES